MKKVKSVAFNIADPMEYALYQYANKHKYFSTYVKRLIQRDMENGHKVDLKEIEKISELFKENTKDEE
ncbi:hypothetical protein E5Z46_18720 [Geobacillus kaustophilus NBRC 102445]|uniref:hypothetical protein n=1 Tax=Geobacillus kaustophilus TaxID=1462 RepID=UPI0010BF2D3B|nr:hypothetical protein [Geobacillus kaustophilus]QCK84052.1 hypothetical protein E5Z46_18720 [Geobacillus kaustophilus NBRC 102445]QHB48451.1 hypothetical protein GBK1_45 [Geobacillus phage GBK1]